MRKNIKGMFFVLLLITLIVGLTAVNATDDSNSTMTTNTDVKLSTSQDVTNTPDSHVESDMKNNNKNLKTATNTVDVNNMNELTTTINNAVKDSQYDEYIINMNEGTYQITANVNYNTGNCTPNIIINANNQTFTGSRTTYYLNFNNKCNISINNAIINIRLQNRHNLSLTNDTTLQSVTNYGNANLTIENSIIGNTLTNQANGITRSTNNTFNSTLSNAGTLYLSDDTILESTFRLTGSGKTYVNDTNIIYPYANTFVGESTLHDIEINKTITNNGTLTLKNVTLNCATTNNGVLIIDDNTVFTENCTFTVTNEIIINDTSRIIPYFSIYDENYTISNVRLSKAKTNNGNLTLINCTIDDTIFNSKNANLILDNCIVNGKITNKGTVNIINSTLNAEITNKNFINIDEESTFGENGEITGTEVVNTTNIMRLLPYITTINGNYTINDVTFNKSYTFIGNNTLNNCNIQTADNENYGQLYINNSTITVDEGENWIINYGVIVLSNDTVTSGNTIGAGDLFTDRMPDDYAFNPNIHIINNDTLPYYFDLEGDGGLKGMINKDDTLDFQGTIFKNHTIRFNKAVNVTSTTNDAYIYLNTTSGSLLGDSPGNSFVVDNDGSYSNFTNLNLRNTQFWVTNAHYVNFNNMSMVVNGSRVGSGVGQTAIRDNSSYITLNNSWVYTKDNGGSSSFVITYATHITIENSIVQGEGNVGNIIYLNTFNAQLTTPEGNSYNTVRNMTLIGPNPAAGICYGIGINGHDNYFENCNIYYKGTGITTAFGGSAYNNTFVGIKFHNGTGFNAVAGSNIINCTAYDNGAIRIGANSTAYNNTAASMTASAADSIIGGNNVTSLTVSGANAIIENNTVGTISVTGAGATVNNNTITSGTINSNGIISFTENIITDSITISKATNITNNNIHTLNVNAANTNITGNNITGLVTLNSNSNIITGNNITNTEEYTITGSGSDNIITDNYLKSNDKYAYESVNLNSETNTIENNLPQYELVIDTTTFTIGQTANITASIQFDEQVASNINSGKVVFKVNGKTLKDENGKVIYAKIVNGQATIENYKIPDSWNKNNLTISAVYSGSTTCQSLRSDKEAVIIAKEPVFTTEDIQTTIGSTITLKATLNDNDKVINSGKVVFKINGKTLKDSKGRTIYAKITNNIATLEYTLPNTFKAKDYNITATLISNEYDKLEDNKTLSITA